MSEEYFLLTAALMLLDKCFENKCFHYCSARFSLSKVMASKLVQLQAKACKASQFVAKHANSYYKKVLEDNKQYIQDPPTIEKCDQLAKRLFATRLARFFSCGILINLQFT